MVKIEIRKKLVSKPSVIYGYNDNDTIGEDKFIPIYRLYVDNKLQRQFLNIYEAAREAEHYMDLGALTIAYEKNPQSFSSVTRLDDNILKNDLE